MNKQTVPLPPPGGDIQVSALTKTFGQTVALAGINLHLPARSQVAIMGPSGSGKSTLLHCLAGILKPSSGQVFIGRQDIGRLPDRQRSAWRQAQCGFVFQDGHLIAELSALENVALPLLLGGWPRRGALVEAQAWLERMGVGALGDRLPGNLSGGQAQRVAIARALVHRPPLVFADEPTGALDQATGHEVMQILTTACAKTNSTLIVVTHDKTVAAWCERLVEIRDGLVHLDRAVNAATGVDERA